MEAPWKDQLALLDLQELDTKITKLVSRRKKLPQLARLTELTESNKQLAAKLTELSTLKTDKKRAITALENEVAGIETRRKTQQNRLDNGQGSPKELLRLQTEIQQMNKRVEDLEAQLLAVMSEVEQLDAVGQKNLSATSRIRSGNHQSEGRSRRGKLSNRRGTKRVRKPA